MSLSSAKNVFFFYELTYSTRNVIPSFELVFTEHIASEDEANHSTKKSILSKSSKKYIFFGIFRVSDFEKWLCTFCAMYISWENALADDALSSAASISNETRYRHDKKARKKNANDYDFLATN